MYFTLLSFHAAIGCFFLTLLLSSSYSMGITLRVFSIWYKPLVSMVLNNKERSGKYEDNAELTYNIPLQQLLGKLPRAGSVVGGDTGRGVRGGRASLPRRGHARRLHCTRPCYWIWKPKVTHSFMVIILVGFVLCYWAIVWRILKIFIMILYKEDCYSFSSPFFQ